VKLYPQSNTDFTQSNVYCSLFTIIGKNKYDFYSKLSMLIVILNLEKRSVPVIHFILGKAICTYIIAFNAIMFE
jgi:hypothetical protein